MNPVRIKATWLAIMLIMLSSLVLVGCSKDDMTSPQNEQVFITEDPFDDVLKSTDGQTPSDTQGRLARLAEVLGLDEDQIAVLTVAYTEMRDGLADLHDQVHAGDLTGREARDQARDLRAAFEAELQVILTEDQYDQLQEMRQHAHDNGQGNQHGHQNPYDRWQEWLAAIDADTDQVTAVFEALDVMRDGVRDLRDQVREGTLTHEEARDAAELLRADFDAALQTILTEEQYEALMDLRPDCGPRRP